MKTLRLLFSFIFLSGMLFTVFQYLPILEEETHATNTELNKKTQSGENSDSSNDLDDDDCDDDNETDNFLLSSFNLASFHQSIVSLLRNQNYLYSFHHNSIQVPPPKA